LGRHGGIMVDWSRRFDDPIVPPKGKALVTLKDAASYIMALPNAKQQSPECQAATEALLMAAEDRGPLMPAHVLALHSAKPIPEYNPSKEKHWGRRKLRRVSCSIAPQGERPIAIEASKRAGLIAARCHHQDQFAPALRARLNGD
jgi:hypothetical protein